MRQFTNGASAVVLIILRPTMLEVDPARGFNLRKLRPNIKGYTIERNRLVVKVVQTLTTFGSMNERLI